MIRPFQKQCIICGTPFEAKAKRISTCGRKCGHLLTSKTKVSKTYIPANRFAFAMSRIRKDPDTGCWIWTGNTVPDGYGTMSVARGKVMVAHRWLYAYLVGDIPSETVLDHLCRNTSCCNPDHLEPVENVVNLLRGERSNQYKGQTHCKYGHELSAENVLINSKGARVCKTCKSIRRQEDQQRRKQGITLSKPVSKRLLWLDLCAKYGNRCLCCGEKKSLVRDHIIPKSKGGSDGIDNLQPLCADCNRRKSAKTIDYRSSLREYLGREARTASG